MSNNERFNQMLNQCKHPRRVYNMLAGGTPNIQKLCDYINQQPDPQLFMEYLLTFAAQRKPPYPSRPKQEDMRAHNHPGGGHGHCTTAPSMKSRRD